MRDDAGGPCASITISADDGYQLAATHYRTADTTRGVILIAPATGVRQRYYDAFARFLAARGFEVLTWDWRGIADSRHDARLDDPRLTMRAWGERDLQAVIAWGAARAGARPLGFVGHSFGGQGLGLAPNAGLVSRAVFVGAQSGWYGHWARPLRWALAALWHVVMPVTTVLLGRFPSSWLGFGEDLPAGVARDWSAWCRAPEYFGTWTGHAALQIPLLAYSFSDDWVAPRRAANALLARYEGAQRVHHHLRPADIGRTAVGHFGFFRSGFVPGLWDDVGTFFDTNDDGHRT